MAERRTRSSSCKVPLQKKTFQTNIPKYYHKYSKLPTTKITIDFSDKTNHNIMYIYVHSYLKFMVKLGINSKSN